MSLKIEAINSILKNARSEVEYNSLEYIHEYISHSKDLDSYVKSLDKMIPNIKSLDDLKKIAVDRLSASATDLKLSLDAIKVAKAPFEFQVAYREYIVKVLRISSEERQKHPVIFNLQDSSPITCLYSFNRYTLDKDNTALYTELLQSACDREFDLYADSDPKHYLYLLKRQLISDLSLLQLLSDPEKPVWSDLGPEREYIIQLYKLSGYFVPKNFHEKLTEIIEKLEKAKDAKSIIKLYQYARYAVSEGMHTGSVNKSNYLLALQHASHDHENSYIDFYPEQANKGVLHQKRIIENLEYLHLLSSVDCDKTLGRDSKGAKEEQKVNKEIARQLLDKRHEKASILLDASSRVRDLFRGNARVEKQIEGMNEKVAAPAVAITVSSLQSSTSPVVLKTIPRIAWKDIVQHELLGNGSYGDVYKATWQGTEAAIKMLQLKTLSTKITREFEKECDIMMQCLHPSIIRLYGICTEPGHFGMVMEYMQKSLRDRLDDDNELSWTKRISIALEISQGLAFLHSKGILHRDLKSHNILLDKNENAKITDFGLAKVKLEISSSSSKSSKATVGSIRWRAPELVDFPPAETSTVTDVYSLGMILWELASRKLPYSYSSDETVVRGWIAGNKKEKIPEDCPKALAEIIQECWSAPDKRPKASEIVSRLEQLLKELEKEAKEKEREKEKEKREGKG